MLEVAVFLKKADQGVWLGFGKHNFVEVAAQAPMPVDLTVSSPLFALVRGLDNERHILAT